LPAAWCRWDAVGVEFSSDLAEAAAGGVRGLQPFDHLLGKPARTAAAGRCSARLAGPSALPKKREALPDVLDRRRLARLLAATRRDDVWQRNHEGQRERDRLLLALFARGAPQE
jgi:hypothetical protein